MRERPKQIGDEEWAEPPLSMDILVPEPDDGWTGLYDADGNKLYRERVPIGFVGKR